jgi:DNA-binding NtrC family response regulator
VVSQIIRYEVQQLQREQLQGQQQQQLIYNKRAKDKNRILIVDDDDDHKPDNNTTLRLELERNGFQVDTFIDPLIALNHHFSAGMYDMVVLDKKMSKVNAIDLHKKFKKIDPKVRICILGPVEVY